ncbi:flagellar protein FlaG [Paraglaciecola aquimarina]|uniref:Flagellar protein FlaG n=1 Tax=Paraglaciecola aquimarina TaxID=1235557 RepID=A0ABU3T0I3_9ALTE|nr:flagellar protein FlaG [Paraglaciecola aquimarina]MDU0355727.1 flagellar protein FlaG [Paraglaciecola aquimarina]
MRIDNQSTGQNFASYSSVGTGNGGTEVRNEKSAQITKDFSGLAEVKDSRSVLSSPEQASKAEQASNPQQVNSPEQIINAVSEVSEFAQTSNRQLAFSVDENSQKQVVKVTDSESGEVIRQIPSEEFLTLSERLKDLNADVGTAVGVLFNKQV